MGNIFDYLTWRGDLTFTQDPPNAVDALIFSTLTYVDYGEKAARDPDTAVTLRECTEEFFSLEDPEGRARSKKDVELLRRELIEAHLLSRLRDGSRYWREQASL